MEIQNIELKNNDIYFMEVLEDIIVINDNYDGILVLDINFKVIKKMKLMCDITIYASFKKGKEIVLYCPDNKCIVYVNLNLYQYKIISL